MVEGPRHDVKAFLIKYVIERRLSSLEFSPAEISPACGAEIG
jgi:hypothetical protein